VTAHPRQMSRGGAERNSFAESLLVSVATLALLAPLVGGGRGELVAPHADPRFDVSLVVPAQERFLVLCVRPVAFPAARRAALRPASEATDADAVLLAKRTHHTARVLATPAHRSGDSMSVIAILQQQSFRPAANSPAFIDLSASQTYHSRQ
jgi:hypothetical protein